MSDGERAGFTRRWAAWRDGLRTRPAVDAGYRLGVAVTGLVVLCVGIIAIPYPGPGWAIVFVGLAILATEFDWAQRLLSYVRRRYDAAMAWFTQQGLWVQVLGVVFTAAVALGTLWLLGALDFVGEVFGYEPRWLDSPIGIGT